MPNTSIAGGIKVAVVASNVVAGRFFRADKVPEKPTYPYVTCLDPIAFGSALDGDCKTMARGRLSSVDVWQKSSVEDPLLPEKLCAALDGFDVTGTAQNVYSFKVTDCVRVDDPDPAIVHHSITIRTVHGVTVTP